VPPEKVAWIIVDLTWGAIERRLIGQGDAITVEESEILTGFVWASLALDGSVAQ
jgi:hypothetical protein